MGCVDASAPGPNPSGWSRQDDEASAVGSSAAVSPAAARWAAAHRAAAVGSSAAVWSAAAVGPAAPGWVAADSLVGVSPGAARRSSAVGCAAAVGWAPFGSAAVRPAASVGSVTAGSARAVRPFAVLSLAGACRSLRPVACDAAWRRRPPNMPRRVAVEPWRPGSMPRRPAAGSWPAEPAFWSSEPALWPPEPGFCPPEPDSWRRWVGSSRAGALARPAGGAADAVPDGLAGADAGPSMSPRIAVRVRRMTSSGSRTAPTFDPG
jgi:hypothetical protein